MNNRSLIFSSKTRKIYFSITALNLICFIYFIFLEVSSNIGFIKFHIVSADDFFYNITAIVVNIQWLCLLGLLFFCIRGIKASYKSKNRKNKIVFLITLPVILIYLILYIPDYHFSFITMTNMNVMDYCGCAFFLFFCLFTLDS
jgi:hypothetical protein